MVCHIGLSFTLANITFPQPTKLNVGTPHHIHYFYHKYNQNTAVFEGASLTESSEEHLKTDQKVDKAMFKKKSLN